MLDFHIELAYFHTEYCTDLARVESAIQRTGLGEINGETKREEGRGGREISSSLSSHATYLVLCNTIAMYV